MVEGGALLGSFPSKQNTVDQCATSNEIKAAKLHPAAQTNVMLFTCKHIRKTLGKVNSISQSI